jgi:hypothetical protein
MSAGSSVEQECLEVEQPAFVSSKKRSRLVACSVYEVGPTGFTAQQHWYLDDIHSSNMDMALLLTSLAGCR